jgi:hypothetical protein
MHRCCLCPEHQEVVDLHHIVPISENGPNTEDNLMVICPTCHAKIHRIRNRYTSNQLRMYKERWVQLCELGLPLDQRLAQAYSYKQPPPGSSSDPEKSKVPIYKNPRYIVPSAIVLVATFAILVVALIGTLPDFWNLSTPTPASTLGPTDQGVVEDSPQPSPQTPGSPSALEVEELWPVGTECHLDGRWSADLRVLPEGGSGAYDYYVDGVWKASSGTEGVTIRLDRNACTAIVGTLTVKSGGQIVSREFSIDAPECCGK